MVSELSRFQKLLEAEITKQKFGSSPPSLYEPVRYIMALGGKRLRPMLTLLAYDLYKNDVKTVLPYAVAVEAFHNFTLMHDDIMDKAPLRRGKETVHKKWNVNTAILSGDVMLVRVYDLFLSLPPDQLKEVLRIFNKCAAEVCEGQQWDMEFETSTSTTEVEYLNMIKLKTAVLLGFSLELGGYLAGASDIDRKSLRDFGVNIGIGFQLKDDLLDAYGDPKKFGKQVGGDIIANKKTFLLIRALAKAEGSTKTQLHKWLSAKKFSKKEKVAAVKKIFDGLEIATATEKKINQYFQRGLNHLDQLNCDSGKRMALRAFAEDLIQRQS